MSIDQPDFAGEKEISEEVPIERENTLDRIREDYDEPWKGAIREATQNGGDAFGRNRTEGELEEDANLHLQFTIDTDKEIFTYKDNAGGMTQNILEEKLLGIDTPDEVKSAGGGAGAYGRGFYVISTMGQGKTYVETRKGNKTIASTVTNSGEYSEPKSPEDPIFTGETQGTYIQVPEVRDYDLKKLSDWESVENVFVKNFSFLLLRNQVNVTYTIDGEDYHPNPPDMEKYLEKGQLIYKEKLPKFSAEGGEYQIRDLYVIRTDVMDEDPPWEGVAMLKGNKYTNRPFMTVKSYKPQGIPSIKTPPEMIGWCDASDLCPDLENNAHTSFRGNETHTGIKDVLTELHHEHFKKGRTTEERQELASDITSAINELLLQHDDFDDYRVPEGGVPDQGAGDEEDEEDGSESEEKVKGSSSSILKVQAGDRDFDAGDPVPLEAQIENPKDSGHTNFEIHEMRIKMAEAETEQCLLSKSVEVPENNYDTFEIQNFRPNEEGIYTFTAQIRPRPEVVTMEKKPEPLDQSQVTFYVGDIEPPSPKPPQPPQETVDNDDSGDQTSEFSVVRDVMFYPSDDDWKAVVEDSTDGGFEVVLNTNRPEWLAANRITDNVDRRDQIQKRYGTEWGVQEAIFRRNIDDVTDVLGDMTTDDGKEAAEVIQEMLRDRQKILSQMDATIADKYGTEYQS